MAARRRLVLGVMGAGERASRRDVKLAEELGELAARAGWVVLTGGRDAGVMRAALRGAKKVQGSLAVGVLPGRDRSEASPYADVVIATGMGEARNVVNVLSSDVIVACGAGSAGTVSEAALALKAGRPLVLLAPTDEAAALFSRLGRISVAASPAEALALAGRLIHLSPRERSGSPKFRTSGGGSRRHRRRG
jgi:uncharacterized protein (TIGR00725 family)